MENQLMLVLGNVEISWFAVFTAIACLVGTCAACLLRTVQKKEISYIFVCVTYGVPLGLLFGRLLYIFFSSNILTGLAQYLNITNGGFGLYGVIFGVFLAAVIACLFYRAEGLGSLLDCLAVGGALAIAVGRFATAFTSAEIGYEVGFKAFAVYDSNQNIYNLAVYKLDGIYETVIFLICLWFFSYCIKNTDHTISSGITALLMLALHGTNQVVMDSMRADPLKLGMNEFIKISQILGIACCIIILAAFMIISARSGGFGKFHILSLLLIVVAVVLGVFGEYRVGSSNYISNHLIMFAGMVILDWLTVAFALMSVDSPAAKELAAPAAPQPMAASSAAVSAPAPDNIPETAAPHSSPDGSDNDPNIDFNGLLAELKTLNK